MHLPIQYFQVIIKIWFMTMGQHGPDFEARTKKEENVSEPW